MQVVIGLFCEVKNIFKVTLDHETIPVGLAGGLIDKPQGN